MADVVFISYAHEDRPVAKAVAGALKGAGLNVWWDRELIAAQDFRTQISRELRDCSCAIVIWTPDSIRSAFVVDEASVALEQRKLLSLAQRDLRLPLGFGSNHALTFTSRHGEINLPEELVASIGLMIERDLRSSSAPTLVEGEPGRARPASARALGFERQTPVHWFDPRLLVTRKLRLLADNHVGRLLGPEDFDNAEPFLQSYANKAGMTVDWLANTGDGFKSTYTMALIMSQPELEVPGQPALARGDVLVVGGNKVFPMVNRSSYENAFVGPFWAAFPWCERSSAPDLFGLPGTNDRFDRAQSFRTIFCDQQPLGAWRTRQSTPYFAITLPGRWWLWGMDITAGGEISEAQASYFRVVARDLQADNRVIICCSGADLGVPDTHDAMMSELHRFVRTTIEPTGARVKLVLSGGSHLYARYAGGAGGAGGDRHLIVAGGGGAYLHATHLLPQSFTIDATDSGNGLPTEWALKKRHPSRRISRRRLASALNFPVRNWQFLLPLAAAHMTLALAVLDHLGDAPGADRALRDVAPAAGMGELVRAFVHSPVCVVLAGMLLGGLVAFARAPGPRGNRSILVKVPMGAAKVLTGAIHGVLHLGLNLLAVLLAIWAVSHLSSRWFLVLVVATVAGVVGGLFSGFLFGGYLWLCAQVLGTHGRDAFAAFRSSKFKNFVRMRIGEDGALAVYPICVEKRLRHWRAEPGAGQSSPWLSGTEPPYYLIEDEPIRFPPEAPAPEGPSSTPPGGPPPARRP